MNEECGHCGYLGELIEVAIEAIRHIRLSDNEVGTEEWSLYECPRCGEPTLFAHRSSKKYIDGKPTYTSNRSFDGWEQLLPAPRDYAVLPPTVLRAYQQANRVKIEAPPLYAVGIRVTLEELCEEENAEGSTLVEMLDSLATQHKLPRHLADMGHQLRQLGNFGAHAGGAEVTDDDVPIIQEFAEAVFDYVYRAPAKLAALQTSLADRRKGRS